VTDRREMVLRLWKVGFDTKSIEDLLSVPEPVALRWISEERSAKRGLPSPYQDQPARLSA
jgi:hypothetical protein